MKVESYTNSKAIRLAQVEASLKLAWTAVIGGLFNAVVVAATLWSAGPHESIALWLFTIAGLACLRLNHALNHARHHTHEGRLFPTRPRTSASCA